VRLWMKVYERVSTWSGHRSAPVYLSVVSFIDSSIFPISPIFMLIPMSLAKPTRAFFFAAITTVCSVLGGIVGYGLGLMAFKSLVMPLLELSGYQTGYQSAMTWFHQWGYWALVLGSFTPFIPYKIFTVGAGSLQLGLGRFLLVSIFARAARFFLIAGMVRWGGPKLQSVLLRMRMRSNHNLE